jgi:small subunit ribosomal protein S21
MYTVKVKQGDPNGLEKALKSLKSKVIQDGLMENLYRLRAFETPKQKKERKLRFKTKLAKLKRS